MVCRGDFDVGLGKISVKIGEILRKMDQLGLVFEKFHTFSLKRRHCRLLYELVAKIGD
jgi:hypothetical protein